MHAAGDRGAGQAGNDPIPIIDENARPAAPLRPYHILALLPTLGLLGGIPFANRVEPYVLGLPFLLFWVVMWVVMTSVIMAIITALDARNPDDPSGAHAATIIGTPTVSASSTAGKSTR